ncbi:hypothetical protein VSR34_26520 [Paraburkholderia sp. JHI2823]|uniref:hypothetical protein n=1 Tax=Paraburkholderia sp. JHI2823 TaxID=3112960 RepID=UPI00317BB0D1
MNHRHIQTFLTVSAAFFAISTPLHSNASTKSGANATTRCAEYTLSAKAGTNAMPATKAGRKS